MLDALSSVLSPPHRAGIPFIAGAAAAALVFGLFSQTLMWLALAFALFCAYFFRDPARTTPTRAGLVVAPADGRIVSVAEAVPPVELGLGPEQRWRVAIFLSVLDVHVNRSPVDATVTRIAYHPGKFVNAAADKASDENERNGLALVLADGRTLGVVQIAGLIARRIVCEVKEGEVLAAGQRFGIIRFGSRTDLYLPHGVVPLVAEGQLTIGAETVIADLDSAEPRRIGVVR
ncbi:phosphatidylserine decarboxylase [Elioraea sp.]|uniref:phosphatidylserine decarboxylase n=1 Tax=Elioraea sp. TaxID=2185103 RepID=UPI0025C0C363|nr:phosphatidylserine decarboxylase [Elioraea sp.]